MENSRRDFIKKTATAGSATVLAPKTTTPQNHNTGILA